MRSRLPTVWSSRCSVNVAALSTLVSFSREILPQQSRLGEYTQDNSILMNTLMRSALLHALRHHELLVAVRRVHALRAAAAGRLLLPSPGFAALAASASALSLFLL